MPDTTVSISTTIGGKTISGSLTRTGAGEISQQVTLSAGNAGTLSTRTDNDTGIITATSDEHDIETADTVDVYWGEGSTAGVRRGMTVGTVSGTAIPIDGGAGDSLPLVDTEVVADKQVILNTDFLASEILTVACSADYRSSIQFQQSGGTAILSLDVGASGGDGEAFAYAKQNGWTTPFGSDVGKVAVSNGDGENSNVVTIGVHSDTDG